MSCVLSIAVLGWALVFTYLGIQRLELALIFPFQGTYFIVECTFNLHSLCQELFQRFHSTPDIPRLGLIIYTESQSSSIESLRYGYILYAKRDWSRTILLPKRDHLHSWNNDSSWPLPHLRHPRLEQWPHSPHAFSHFPSSRVGIFNVNNAKHVTFIREFLSATLTFYVSTQTLNDLSSSRTNRFNNLRPSSKQNSE